MPRQTAQLAGSWAKITDSACSRMYPAAVEFQRDGSYVAQNSPSAGFLIWDVGAYAPDGTTHVRISLANDAVISYQYAIANNILTFIDPDGCKFQYRRVAAPLDT